MPFQLRLQYHERKITRRVHRARLLLNHIKLPLHTICASLNQVGGVREQFGTAAFVDPCACEGLEVESAWGDGGRGDGGEDVCYVGVHCWRVLEGWKMGGVRVEERVATFRWRGWLAWQFRGGIDQGCDVASFVIHLLDCHMRDTYGLDAKLDGATLPSKCCDSSSRVRSDRPIQGERLVVHQDQPCCCLHFRILDRSTLDQKRPWQRRRDRTAKPGMVCSIKGTRSLNGHHWSKMD